MATIIVSGLPAVGKTTLAKALAERLNLTYYGGGDALKEMAIKKGYKPSGEDWWDTEDGMKFLEERKHVFNFDKEVDKMMILAAKKDNVVLTSYTVPWIVRKGYKVWLAGSVRSRARRMAKRDGLSYSKALEVVKKRDAENASLYKELYGFDFGKDLTPFDLIVDTDGLSEEEVVQAVRSIIKLSV